MTVEKIEDRRQEYDNIIYCADCDEQLSVVLDDKTIKIKCLICGKELNATE